MRDTRGEKIFYFINTCLLILLTALIVYPVIYVISASLSSREAILTGKVFLFPKDFNIDAYKYVFSDKQIWISYLNSFYYTIVGTFVCMLITVFGAYPLSREKLPGKKILIFLAVLTMWLAPGLIPRYLTFRDFGLINTRTSMIIGFACNTFNFVLLRNFFLSIPQSMEEAAEIDGAGQWRILFQIYIPLSLPAMATISLFYAVEKWNGYFWSMILLNDSNLIPLQVVIKKMIVDLQGITEKIGSVDDGLYNFSQETVVYASIVVSALPMLLLYPFIQKFFVKGVMVGAVKG